MVCLIRFGWHLFVGCFFLFGALVDVWANVAPIARNDSVRVEQNGKINIAVLANDTDADGDSLFSRGVLTDAPHSQLLVRNSDGTIHYRPQLEFVGQDSFVYLIDDGKGGLAGATVYVTVFSLCAKEWFFRRGYVGLYFPNNIGTCVFDGRMDFDGDGVIAFTDFLRFVGLFGKTTTGG